MVEEIVWCSRRMTRCGMVTYWMLKNTEGVYGAAIGTAKSFAVLHGVTSDAAQMRVWCKLLAKGRVRPCHLRDVMENLLCR